MSENKELTIIDQTVDVIHILNPFDTSKSATEQQDWRADKTLDEYACGYERKIVISCNGGIVEKEDWGSTTVRAGDSIVICPVPESGANGGRKQMMRMIAMMAVTQGAGAAANGLELAGGEAFLFKFAVVAAGAMLIDSIMPIEPEITEDLSASPTYGIDGAKNVSTEGIAVPICYGAFRMAGNIIGTYVENDGDTQNLYMLLNAGEGPIAGIDSFTINDQPLAGYQDVVTATRFGNPDQPVIPWFDDTVTPVNKGVTLGTGWTYHVTGSDVSKLRIDIVFPSGLYGVYINTGRSYAYGVTMEFEYRVAGSADPFIPLPHEGLGLQNFNIAYDQYFNAGYVPVGTEVVDGDVIRDVGGVIVGYVVKRYEYLSSSPFTITENKKSAYRRSFATVELQPGSYELRFRRTTAQYDNSESEIDDQIADQVVLSDINEIITQNVTYAHTALAAIKIRLTDQLNNIPNVTFINRGRIIRTIASDGTTVYAESNNPAWIVLDMLTHSRYGANTTDDRIDMEMFIEWAAHCTNNNLTFDGVLDVTGNVWDSMKYVLTAGHAQIVMIGTKFSLAIERPDTPVMMFGMGNIVKDSFSLSWLPIEERANEIEVSFFDKNDNYKQRTIKVYDEAAFNAGKQQNSSSLTLRGIVDAQRAYDEGVLLLNMNRYIQQSISFEAPLEAIACTVGDLIYVQHDMPQWGYAGRINTAYNTSSVRIDSELPEMLVGSTYTLLIHQDAVERYTGTVSAVNGVYITLAGFDDVETVKRLQVAGLDLRVVGTFNSGPDYGVEVEDATGISVTDAYSLFDTDVIEEREVSSVSVIGDYKVVNVATPFTTTPGDYANYMFGEVTKVKKPFRITSINGGHEYTRKISAIEYNASVYDPNAIAVSTPNYSALIVGAEHVTITQVTETLVTVGSMIRTQVTVNWQAASDKAYGGADVYVGMNGATPEYLGNVSGYTKSFMVEADDGDDIVFKVVSYDILGAKASYETAPQISHTVVGKTAPPADVLNFRYTKVLGGLNLEWDANTDIDLDGYEIRVGTSWSSGAVVSARHSSLSVFVPISAEGSYTYHIKAKDTSDNYSVNAVSLVASLVTPGDVLYFDVTQNNTQMSFRWPVVENEGTLRYEIREGDTWVNSVLVAIVNSNSYSMTADSIGTRMFWVKAVDAVGLYSANATFVTTDIVQLSNYNALYTSDQRALGFPGYKYNTTVQGSGELRLDDTKFFGEYQFEVDLGATYRARNTLEQTVRSVLESGVTWAAATFTWGSQSAKVPWLNEGDPHSINFLPYISRSANLDPSYIEAFSFKDTTTGANGTTPDTATTIAYTQGRYFNGIHNTEGTTVLNYTMSIPAQFSISMWLKADDLVSSFTFMTLSDGVGGFIIGYYNPSTAQFSFFASGGLSIFVPFSFAAGDHVLLAMSQTATTFSVGAATADGVSVWHDEPVAPGWGTLTLMQL